MDNGVGEDFVVHGLGDYVILRLCNLLWNEHAIVRTLIGMCESNYRLKEHIYFRGSRPTKISSSLGQIMTKEFIIKRTPEGEECTFKRAVQTVFVNRQIDKGVFRWNIYFKYETTPMTVFKIGISPPNLVSECSNVFLGSIEEMSCEIGWCEKLSQSSRK